MFEGMTCGNAEGSLKCRRSWVRFVLGSDAVRSLFIFNLDLSVFQ
jgi:hypothetical protein